MGNLGGGAPAPPGPGGSGIPAGGGLGGPPRINEGPTPGAGAGIGAAPGGATKPSDTISIQTGETIRYRMATKQTIDRVLNQDTKVAEILPDPTDASRILIRGLTVGGARLELTDSTGTKEKYTVRVK